MLSMIERATRSKILQLELPSTEVINDKRVAKFMQRITDTLAQGDLTDSAQMLEQQNTDEWEQGLSNVQLTADGSIINVRSSQLMPVAEEEDEVIGALTSSACPRICFCACFCAAVSLSVCAFVS